MADIYSSKKRSQIMLKISGKETKPEILVRRFLFAQGFRYRKNVKELPGKPDIFLPKYKTAIFIHGCFWHGHNCKAGMLPETRREFWEKKISDNVIRDLKNTEILQRGGWKVFIIWQCEIKNQSQRNKRLDSLSEEIKQN